MIIWTAECPRCGEKQKIPNEHRHIDDAKKWAAIWQKQHFLEVHKDDSNKKRSEEDS